MWQQIVDLAHNEIVAYLGMMLILSAFFLETRDILNSKEWTYLVLMALGSGLLAVRAYLIDEWAFFILEVAWFAAAALGLWSIPKQFELDYFFIIRAPIMMPKKASSNCSCVCGHCMNSNQDKSPHQPNSLFISN